MVLQGKFSLQLVNAQTMKPFKEHSDYTGKTFVRMEPNVDFFLRLNNEDTTNSVHDDSRQIFYQAWVSNTTNGGKSGRNFKRRWNPNQITRPDMDVYRFERPSSSTASDTSVVMEHVKVRVYEAAQDKESARHYEQARRNSNDTESSAGSRKGNRGSQHISRANSSKLLQTITIYCCVLPNNWQAVEDENNAMTQDFSLLRDIAGSCQTDKLQPTSLKRKVAALHPSMTDNHCYPVSRITPEREGPTKLRRLVL